ncbi:MULTISPECIES: peptide deformylase [Rhodomicrobium]|uniref:peptide deformylase n=1 Tax=Rhodomicrobium TaxID=1068 RepID=UPI000B4B0D1E|nr:MULTISPECIES: peptide deformylase [Rhodomicrobium]
MAKRPIILYPDPILRKAAAPVERVDTDTLRLLADMLETMYVAPGVGLAAPQIGVSRRIFVMDPAKGEEPPAPRFLINPEILESGDARRTYEEGCLSIPDIFAEVERPASILVRYLDKDGKLVEEWLNGHAATVAQHEIDHLDGVLFIDHLSRLKRNVLVRKYRRARRDETTE